MIRKGKLKPYWQFWTTIVLLSLLGMYSNVSGQARILLNNYTSDCPIIDVDHLAADEDLFIEVRCQPTAGGSYVTVFIETNSSIALHVKEPGFFDGGVGIIPDSPSGLGYDTYLIHFEIRFWKGATSYDFANVAYTFDWTQPVDLSAIGTNNVAPTPLMIPFSAIWIMCADCVIAEDVFTAVRGKGKVEMNPPSPPWGPVSLHAVADPGYRFVNWKGTLRNFVSTGVWDTNEWLNFTYATGAANFLATFEPDWQRLQVNVPYGGWVTNNPPGFDYTPGTQVTLTAKAKPFFEFSGWTGNITGTNPTVTIQMNSNITVVANFRPILMPQLVLQPSVTGDGISSNGFGFTLLGTPGAIYSIESSPDLTNWTVFTHLTATNRIIQFTDIPNRNGGAKYYRAHSN